MFDSLPRTDPRPPHKPHRTTNQSFWDGANRGRSLHFTGVTSKLEEAMGIDAAKIEAAVSTRAAAVSPSATRAIWDAEAWIDYANNAATTTFTLDDGASTMISVTRSSDGTIEAL